MVVSENVLKWAMRFYPPLFFQRIWVARFGKDFRSAEVHITKSILNLNYNRSVFGGTIFSAADPFYSVLLDQVMQRNGFKVRVWLKSASISYLKPGRSRMHFKIQLEDKDVEDAIAVLNSEGKFVRTFSLQILNRQGEVCANVQNEVYIRRL
ncbi:DUF4442 domain-containing protein [Hufsiella ginkgonis]|uniref:DUF4442 domain-containing protein n=1 Tax=Hufsiella ginkgonis TaxID=2695274 RepID=A0A7K1XVK8_9SPHI|nr:DUF4442 domain-containing protein [Hufsiella ginkgonis]MXV15021.1 DUF4442 domain-containing protein [Hufsiella ginkgonis]